MVRDCLESYCSDDELNRLVFLKIGAIWHEFKYDGESEILTSWCPFGLKERKTLFNYRNGMLSTIIHPNTDKEIFTWITTLNDFEQSGNRYIDNVKFNPVLLSEAYIWSLRYSLGLWAF